MHSQRARFELEADVVGLQHQRVGISVKWVRVSAETETGRADQEDRNFDGVVICAGVASRLFARMLGDRVNIYPVKGYSITVHLDDERSQEGAPWVSLLDDGAKIVTSRLGKDRFRVAGTAEINGVNYDIRADRIAPLVRWTRRYFPDINTSQVTPWSGLRPMMPNMLPRVGKGRQNGVFYNTGHGHLGWTLSCATAELVGETVAGAYAT
ncbi:FAD-dependent oxidoreductase (plasmid) [Rhizobium sp. CB3060]|uniref:FAD-dependent oxidoreductase n=1 Tax=Rhizobium sp. CB3060 TaxID=3138255 RepID=UPI0021A6BC00|nr:FAD-dependent oxidoreductase [Rhizobium tropici]UWU25658.1 FAD-dependent oxidoreductase [Rhizobium tropici]